MSGKINEGIYNEMSVNIKPKISIAIPTVKYHEYLDQTIKSCLDISIPYEIEIVVSINNKNMNGFENSIYFNTAGVQWKCSYKDTVPIHDSFNLAISYTNNDWLYLLSDDDFILDGFLEGIDLSLFTENTLYATRINIIDENNNIIKENSSFNKSLYSGEEAKELFFKNNIHHHLSLLLFHKKMYEKVGAMPFGGYPNGYYVDSIFHGKAFIYCDYLVTSKKVVFSRRESLSQQSAKFYFGKSINNYFEIIVDTFFENEDFKREVLKRYSTKKNFYKKMIQDRFFVDWGKYNNEIYSKNTYDKINFLYNYFLFWNTGFIFKITSICYVILFPMKHLLSKRVINLLKKLAGR